MIFVQLDKFEIGAKNISKLLRLIQNETFLPDFFFSFNLVHFEEGILHFERQKCRVER